MFSCIKGRDAVSVKATPLDEEWGGGGGGVGGGGGGGSYLEPGLHLEQELQDTYLHLWYQVLHIMPCSKGYMLHTN